MLVQSGCSGINARLVLPSAVLRPRPSEMTKHKFIVRAEANNGNGPEVDKSTGGLGDLLGPIGLTVGKSSEGRKNTKVAGAQMMQNAADAAGLSLGPIGLTIGSDLPAGDSDEQEEDYRPESIATMTTAEWRAKYERDGRVDLWVQEEFNAASRLVGGRAVHFGGEAGHLSGEGKGLSSTPRHKVKIHNPACAQELEVEVPEDRYILWEAEDQGLVLPYACRMGCCTACAVKVKSGDMYQPQSLGISKELRELGYGLMCVGFPLSDLELELCPDELMYDEQFGKFFEAQAINPNAPTVSRDDFAIELALGDE